METFSRYWPFVRGIHRSPVNSPHKCQWRGALIFSLICTRINGWVDNGEAGDLRRHRAHYDVTVMQWCSLHGVFILTGHSQKVGFSVDRLCLVLVVRIASLCCQFHSNLPEFSHNGCASGWKFSVMVPSIFTWWNRYYSSLQWGPNESDGLSNHKPHDCLLNRLFEAEIKENIKVLRHWPLWGEFIGDRWFSTHKGPVTWTMFPVDDVILRKCI